MPLKIIDAIVKFSDLDDQTKMLIQEAVSARNFSYSPYSNFRVGAAFRTESGKIFSGCNIENAGFTPSQCAERTALGKAISEGARKFSSAAVVAFQEDSFTSPCGVCRQFMMEFAEEDFLVYLAKDEPEITNVLCTSVFNLLPYGFKTYKEK
uniref:Cytidine deaminase n=1 Tax=Megaselia scalaris TaxID=36166 RepID=T1GD71_MEGSC